MFNARISALASYVPDDILDNDMLSKMVDTNDEWITTRVGIKERRIPTKTVQDHRIWASRPSISSWPRTLSQGRRYRPAHLRHLQPRLPLSVDSVHHCIPHRAYRRIRLRHPSRMRRIYRGIARRHSIYTLRHIQERTGSLHRKMSSMIDYTDRSTCALFGDGAAAALVQPTEQPDTGVIDGLFHVDGSGLEHLVMLGGGSAHPTTQETLDKKWHFLRQDGRHVYKTP